ncbi:hypothetical protein AC578_4721 [Pseudocercospora eumusae]|uniref:Uncharacterized protein n=1 Tax=Pseudocercospora eumusae TaxID=321146 RepID=A0A139GZ10_9PEZI|nr:hypothetical protein AC578_4721 [Pseudocercospora eumusae]
MPIVTIIIIVRSPSCSSKVLDKTPLRDRDTSFSCLMAVELEPGIMNWMVADRKGVHSSPQAPPRPSPNMWMDLSGHN